MHDMFILWWEFGTYEVNNSFTRRKMEYEKDGEKILNF
jgi:hypothetical protein